MVKARRLAEPQVDAPQAPVPRPLQEVAESVPVRPLQQDLPEQPADGQPAGDVGQEVALQPHHVPPADGSPPVPPAGGVGGNAINVVNQLDNILLLELVSENRKLKEKVANFPYLQRRGVKMCKRI
jgi:hypothetical protein